MLLSALFCGCLLISVTHGSDQRNKITIHDGGYENVLIAINKDVEEDQTIIDNIIDIFSSGSGHLFTATRRRAYWRNITILIPKTWSSKPEYEPARTETFETANVIIDSANPEWEDNPYTLQLGGCGQHGEYIHLTPNYIVDRPTSEYIWGPMDKLLTHEWGHLRWGLFDEYPTDDEGTAKFYANSRGEIEATRCTSELAGEALNINSFAPCQRDPATGLYEQDCFYFPNLNGQSAPASIMYAQFLDSVTGYCHSEVETPGFHNREAPNKHNVLCASRSAWDVMLETEDFEGDNNPPIEAEIDTTPTFRLVQAQDRRVVLVLDTSGSMGNNDRLTKLNQAATQYLRYTIDNGSYVGIVEFHEVSMVLSELEKITDSGTRDELVAALPMVADGFTCIGCGVLDGIEVLRGPNRDQNPAGGYILLVSDGIENRAPYIDDVFDDVEEAGVIIDTIAFSDAADPKLLELSARTNGLAFFYPDTANSTALNDAFTATISSRPGLSSETLPIQIYSGAIYVPADGPVEDTFLIDSSLGVDTVLIFSWLDSPISVVVTDPSGVSINSSDTDQYRIDQQSQLIAITISDTAQPGLWTFSVDSSSPREETVLVTVESKASSSTEEPITVNAVVGSQTINHAVTPTLEIFAEVRKGYVPVVNAVVQALIESPGAATTILPLYDNGAGADITKYDGIYSGYFLEFDNNGRYSIKVQVTNDGSTASISSRSKRGSRGLPLAPDRYTPPPPPTFEPAEPFVRTGSGGVFEVENFVAPVGDQLAPSRITDLSVIAADYDQSSVTLRWTAVGDDLDQGLASSYDLRFATSFAVLQDNFTSCSQVLDDQLISGNLSVIGPSGSVETITVTVPTRGKSVAYFFGIIAADDADNVGDLSNIVSASLEFVPPMTTKTMSTESMMTEPEVRSTPVFVEPDTGLEPWAIGLVCGASVLFALGVCVVILVTYKQMSASQKKVDNSPDTNENAYTAPPSPTSEAQYMNTAYQT